MFSLISSSAFFAIDVSAAFWGEVADAWGPRLCTVCAASLSCIGFVGLAAGAYLKPYFFFPSGQLLGQQPPAGGGGGASSAESLDSMSDAITFGAVMLLAAAGPGVFNGALVGAHQLLDAAADGASLKSALSSLTAAAFEGSALVFVLLEACATRLYATHRAADEVHGLVVPSLAWAVLCAAVGTVLFRQLEPAKRRRDSSTLPLNSLASTSLSSASLESQDQDPPAPASAAMPPAHPPPRLLLVLLQPHNIGVMAFQSLYQLQSNFYLQTVQDSYESLLGVESAAAFVATFHVAFPVSGFIATFPVTAILERTDSRPHVYWGAIAASILLLHLLWLVPSASAQLAVSLLFGPVRCFCWAAYFHFLASDVFYPQGYLARTLGYNNLVIGVIGAVGPYLLSQRVAAASSSALEGETDAYLSLRLHLLVGTALLPLLPLHLFLRGRRKDQEARVRL